MTQSAQEWLEGRAAGVPPMLMERIRAVAAGTASVTGTAGVGAEGAQEGDQAIQALSRAVAAQLAHMREREGVERRDALDLLTADALVTYLLELVASVRPEALDAYAVDLMRLVCGV